MNDIESCGHCGQHTVVGGYCVTCYRDERETKAAAERRYREYVADRDSGLSHAEIVSEGVYGKEVEAFALRYSLAVAAYADAMRQPRDGPQYSTDGRLIGSEYVAPIPERKSQP